MRVRIHTTNPYVKPSAVSAGLLVPVAGPWAHHRATALSQVLGHTKRQKAGPDLLELPV